MLKQLPNLTDDEWTLLRELLEHERRELISEVRRSQTTATRETLRRRAQAADHIMHELQRCGIS
jgi:hypothetical protein